MAMLQIKALPFLVPLSCGVLTNIPGQGITEQSNRALEAVMDKCTALDAENKRHTTL